MERVSTLLTTVYYAVFGDKIQQKQAFIYRKEIKIALVLVVSLVALFFMHRMYVGYREKNAQAIFAECLEQYDRAGAGDTSVSWAMVADMWQHGYTLYSRSYLAPYFLAYKADSLMHDNRKKEACKVMAQALKSMPVSSPLYYQYKLKEIMMQGEAYYDGVLEGHQIGMLQQLAYDKKNTQRDQALYYLGLHYWVNNALRDAAVVWKELVELSTASDSPSAWAQLVEEKVNQLVDSGFLYSLADVELETITDMPLEPSSAATA